MFWHTKKTSKAELQTDFFATRTSAFTPDRMELDGRGKHLLFVCDDQQSGHPASYMMDEAHTPIRHVVTKEKFTVWKKKQGKSTFPIPLREEHIPFLPHAHIRGELYAVPPHLLSALDKVKQNTVQFTRERVKVFVPYLERFWNAHKATFEVDLDGKVFIRSWMYVGISEYWRNEGLQPRSGPIFSSVGTYRSTVSDREYYHFTEKDYEF